MSSDITGVKAVNYYYIPSIYVVPPGVYVGNFTRLTAPPSEHLRYRPCIPTHPWEEGGPV